MQRWTAVVFVGLVALAIAVVLARTGQPSPSALAPARAPSDAAYTQPSSTESSTPSPAGLHADGTALALAPLDGPGVDANPGTVANRPIEADAGGLTLPNGQPAPQLPASAPKAVAFGAVLVEYAGAEGAAPGARSRQEALTLANKLAAQAKTDFKGAVSQGDKGSGDDFGAMPRNVLEPAPEFVLFSLKTGEVSDPVDSPRGFYVFKRND